MNGKEVELEPLTTDVKPIRAGPPVVDVLPAVTDGQKVLSKKVVDTEILPKKKKAGNSFLNALYNPRMKTFLGRDGLQWGESISRPHRIAAIRWFL